MEVVSKEALIESILAGRKDLERSLEGLSETELSQPGVVGDWSVKDLLAHLFDWEQRCLGWYEAGLCEEDVPVPAFGFSWEDLDRLNQQIYEKHRERDLHDVLAEFHCSYDELLATVVGMSEGELFTPGHFSWTGVDPLAGFVMANTGEHYRWASELLCEWKKGLCEG